MERRFLPRLKHVGFRVSIFMTIEDKVKEFKKWLYKKQSDWEWDGMVEELVGLNEAIRKMEELEL